MFNAILWIMKTGTPLRDLHLENEGFSRKEKGTQMH